MSGYGGYPPHDDAQGANCRCWSCHNRTLVQAELARRKVARAAAITATADMVVEYPRKTQNDKKDFYRFLHGGVVVEGPLVQSLTNPSPYEKPVVDAFLQLPMLERGLVLEKARKLGRIRIGDMGFDPEKPALED